MEVYERINSILQSKNITKREFAKRLQDLEAKLKSTGEIPNEKTVYKYLNGTIGIKIELIPFIAEALQVQEQELFTNDNKSRKLFFQNLLKTANSEEIEILQHKFNLKYNTASLVKEPTNSYHSQTLEEELIQLLPYAPKPLLANFLNKLKELKEFNETI